MGIVVPMLFQGAAIGVLAMAAAVDVKTRLIPDVVTLWVAVLGLAARVCLDGWLSWLSVAVAFCVVVPLGVLSHHKVLGGGDAKMLAAVTMVFTPALAPFLLLAISLAGGVLSIGYLVAYATIKPSPPQPSLCSGALAPPRPLDLFSSERERIADREPLPYGVAILAGALIVFAQEASQFLPAISF